MLALSVPLLVGIAVHEFSLNTCGKFLLEMLMTYSIIEVAQLLENTFASETRGHPTKISTSLSPTGSDMLYFWICFAVVKYVVMGPVRVLLTFGVGSLPLGGYCLD